MRCNDFLFLYGFMGWKWCTKWMCLDFSPPKFQVGLWCNSNSKIIMHINISQKYTLAKINDHKAYFESLMEQNHSVINLHELQFCEKGFLSLSLINCIIIFWLHFGFVWSSRGGYHILLCPHSLFVNIKWVD